MKIAILVPSLYMQGEEFRKRISAPMELSVALADGLVDRGHKVLFFSGPGVPTKAHVLTFDNELLNADLKIDYQQDLDTEGYKAVSLYERKKYFELSITQKAYEFAQKEKIDVIHVYHAYGNLAHYFAEMSDIPTLFTLHVFPPPENTLERWRYNRFKEQNFIAISNSQKRDFEAIVPGMHFVDTLYHGIKQPQSEEKNSYDYLAFIGRLIAEKGLDKAIQAALAVNFPLKIATDVNSVIEKSEYYQKEILPFLDNKKIEIKGIMPQNEKYDFLAHAKAFVFPLQWNEPFGMVLIESLAVGTPVIAFNRGSVPEIIVDGVTGFLVDPEAGNEGIIVAVKKLMNLSQKEYLQMRKNCKEHFNQHFSFEKMVDGYEKVYQDIVSRHV